METLPRVAIIELGSQLTLVIARTLRELGYQSIILNTINAQSWIEHYKPKAIILSGGHRSVYEKDAPEPPENVLAVAKAPHGKTALLGICYGMQWITHRLGGTVSAALGHREYGEEKIRTMPCEEHVHPFLGTPEVQSVWMSHGDTVLHVPSGFDIVAKTKSGTIAAMIRDRIWGVQFHPEVTHTEYGKEYLKGFLAFAGCTPDLTTQSLVDSIRKDVAVSVGTNRAVIGFSGGVDSTTAAALVAPILNDRLLAITIDGGHLRDNELEEIEQHAKAAGVVNHIVIDARDAFQRALGTLVDAEARRKKFKQVYENLFIESARNFEAKCIIQGTLAPDRIESGATGGASIKSHHNVGLTFGGLREIKPTESLFKHEVRKLAAELGLPRSVYERQPFPGPGLFLRVLGTPATLKMLALVRWLDARTREILEKHGVYDTLSQLVVAYSAEETVGVKGDGRVYLGSAKVRAIRTTDFMTAEGVYFPKAVAKEITSKLTSHPEIVRVFFDATDKPPATTEFQ